MGVDDSAHTKWNFLDTASTGALKAQNVRGFSDRFTAFIETGPGCTATVRLEARAGSSAGPYGPVTNSTALSTSAVKVEQFAGPIEWIRPYCTAKTTGTLSVELFGN